MSTNNVQSVVCVLVSQESLVRLKRAIQCYKNQTYVNKQLLIVTNGKPFFQEAIERYLTDLKDDSIQFITEKDTALDLNKLRQIAISHIDKSNNKAALLCIWDQNYQYHMDRISIQVEFMLEQGANAVFLVEELQLFENDQILFISDQTKEEQDPRKHLIPETLLVDSHIDISEFPAGINFIDALLHKKAAVSGLSGQPFLALKHHQVESLDQNQVNIRNSMVSSADKEKNLSRLPQLSNILHDYWIPTPLGIYSGEDQIGIYNL